MKFYSPYQFIPFKKTDQNNLISYEQIKEGKVNFIRHDRWDDDSCSGRILCKLTTVSPLVIGAEQDKNIKRDNKEGENEPDVYPYCGGQAIPGNSLRGMISNVTEVISNSSMRVLSNQKKHTYSVRKQMEGSLKAIGLLRKNQEKKWYITPLVMVAMILDKNDKKVPQKWRAVFDDLGFSECLATYVGDYKNDPGGIDTKQLNAGRMKTYQHFDNEVKLKRAGTTLLSDIFVNDKLHKNTSGIWQKGSVLLEQKLSGQGETTGVYYVLAGDGRTVGDTIPKNKKHELFIPWPTNLDARKQVSVDDKTVLDLALILHNRKEASQDISPFLPVGYENRFSTDKQEEMEKKLERIVKEGDLLYFDVDTNGKKVTELSYSAIWRRPVGDLYDAINQIDKNLLPWNGDQGRDSLTPAEALFGVVEEKPEKMRNLASRLRFCDAVAEEEVALEELQMLKILASPKPPSPSMYFRTAVGKYISKSDLDLGKENHVPNGRKRYLTHHAQDDDGTRWKTKDDEANTNQKLSCKPIPPGESFWFRIDFENLSKDELDLLRKAITPAPTFFHQLGLGKPLGLGKITVEESGLFLINRKQRYTVVGLKAERYSQWWGDVTELPNKIFLDELKFAQSNTAQAPMATESNYIDEDSLAVIQSLGNPEEHLETGVPICYPFDAHAGQESYGEGEGFKWFVENEKSSSPQHLKSIKPGEVLPTLSSNHRKK